MSDDRNQNDDDLFDIEDSESSTDAVSTTETEKEELDLGEENENEKPSSQAKPIALGEAQRQKMVDVWTNKVTQGEVDLDDLPAKQKWMKPLIEQQLGLSKKTQELDQTAEQIIDRKLAEKEETNRFKTLKQSINSKQLSTSQKAQVESEFKDLRSSGLSPAKALEKALKIAGVVDEDDNSILRRRMTIPAVGDVGSYTGKPTRDGELPVKEEDRLKLYAEMAKSR